MGEERGCIKHGDYNSHKGLSIMNWSDRICVYCLEPVVSMVPHCGTSVTCCVHLWSSGVVGELELPTSVSLGRSTGPALENDGMVMAG